MLMPKRVKFRRVQRGRMKGVATRGNTLTNGSYGLVALEPSWISSAQIEAARLAMTRYIRRGGERRQGGYNRENRGGYNRDNRGGQGFNRGPRPAAAKEGGNA